jgi:integrase/recombinase XerD
MIDKATLGTWIKRFLLEYITAEKNFSRNTQKSYRDTVRLLVLFLAAMMGKRADELLVADLSASHLREFLKYIQEHRRCSTATRNQRLAAVHALARYIGQHSPESLAWCAEIHGVPFKRTTRLPVPYLEKNEIDALLNEPDRTKPLGRRDYTLLLFLYNSGARANEAAQLAVGDLNLRRHPSARLRGKGDKVRFCPLWNSTVAELKKLTEGRSETEPVFLNRFKQPMTRFGVHDVVTRYACSARSRLHELRRKRISPHTLRHTTATHLLRSGVDINTIRSWLGHVSLETTNIYAEHDLEMKAKALEKCGWKRHGPQNLWRDNPNLLAFLQNL